MYWIHRLVCPDRCTQAMRRRVGLKGLILAVRPLATPNPWHLFFPEEEEDAEWPSPPPRSAPSIIPA
jgi:hypothetical protein